MEMVFAQGPSVESVCTLLQIKVYAITFNTMANLNNESEFLPSSEMRAILRFPTEW